MKPMLAAKCPRGTKFEDFLSQLRFPVLATPKIDGIRCVTKLDLPPPPGMRCYALTRSLKPVPNRHVSEQIMRHCAPGLDGELVCGTSFQAVTSGIMSHGGTPDFTYFVFDYVSSWVNPIALSVNYRTRGDNLSMIYHPKFVRVLSPIQCNNLGELLFYEESCLKDGAEGVCIRTPESPYKFGRSTLREQYLVAIKRFDDSEAVIIGMTELQHNDNVPTQSELGYQTRTTHAGGMTPGGVLGSFRVRDIHTNVEFNVGTGLDAGQRNDFWQMREELLGRTIKYKFQAHGTKDAPRIPVFLGFRDEKDL